MFSIRHHSLTRLILHGLTIFGLVVLAAGVSATPAYALPPTNDDFLTPAVITVAAFTHIIADINQATGDALDPFLSCESGFGQGDATVWYTFTPTNPGVVTLNTANSAYDTVLAVFMDDPFVPGSLLELGCNNNASLVVTTSALTLNLRAGIKYYVEVARDSLSPLPTLPDPMRLNFSFVPKTVAFGTAGGQKWDSNYGSVFAYSAGWTTYPFAIYGAYKDAIRVSNNVNNTAVLYFDGVGIDLTYYHGPLGGNLDVYVDDVLQTSLHQNAPAVSLHVWSSGWIYSDGIHKLTLKHAVGFSRANFDYVTVYSFPDFIPPDPIFDLTATVGTTTGLVTLSWTSVGDDGMVGTATSYEVQYMPNDGFHTCAVDWGGPDAGIINWGLPVPKIAGTVQTTTLTGLIPGYDYLFCIAAIDDGGNYGFPSNDATAIPLAGAPFDTGIYDDRHGGWLYFGNWKLLNQAGARNNTLHVSNKMGDYAYFYFTGTQFVLTYSTGPIGAILDVYIDGLYETSIDTYSPFPALARIYTSRILAAGPHSVRFEHNYWGPPPPQVQVTIDQIYINTPNDYGAPDPIVDLVAVPGAIDGEVDLTWTATGDDPLLSIPPGDDTAVKYEIRYSTSPIIDDNTWFLATPAAGVVPAPSAIGTPEFVTVTDLTPGVDYYFAVRVFDDAFYEVLSNTTNATATFTGLWNGGGNYDDTNPGWTYNGGWVTKTTCLATNCSQHMTGFLATSAVFHFNGTGFTLLHQRSFNLGRFDVYVDGVKVGTIFQSAAPYIYQAPWISPVFPLGNHVVEFRLIGTRATIDEIIITP